MLLFIGESIGMQELLFIGVIALIVLGPRRLPQLAKTLGKFMAEFRRTTNDFKETWEREVNFEDFKDEGNIKTIAPVSNAVAKNGDREEKTITALPEIKEIDAGRFEQMIPLGEPQDKTPVTAEKTTSGKQNWL